MCFIIALVYHITRAYVLLVAYGQQLMYISGSDEQEVVLVAEYGILDNKAAFIPILV